MPSFDQKTADSLTKFIESANTSNSSLFDSISKNLVSINDSIGTIINKENVKPVATAIGNISDYSQQLNQLITTMTKSLEKMTLFSDSLKDVVTYYRYIATKLEHTVDYYRLEAQDAKNAKKKQKKSSSLNFARQEASKALNVLNPYLSKLMIPGVGGVGLLGGFFKIITFSIEEQQKKKQYIGVAKNILAESVDSGIKGMLSSASSDIGAFAYKAEKLYGMPIDQIMGSAKAFMDAGVSIKETIKDKYDASLGEVGKNLAMYALALDKMYEMSGGSSAAKMTEFMKRYGMSTKEAADAYTDMLFYSREMNVGQVEFTSWIDQSQDSLEQMGYSVDQVLELSAILQERFRNMGVPKFLAGRQVLQGINNLTTGVAGLSLEMKSFMAKEMGYGSGVEGYMRFVNNLEKLTKGDDNTKFAEEMARFAESLVKRFGGDESAAWVFAENKLNFKAAGANILFELMHARREGDISKGFKDEKEREEFMKIVSASFGIESEKMSPMQKLFNKWMLEVSKIGQNILSILMDILALLIVGFKEFVASIGILGSDKSKEEKDIMMSNLSTLHDKIMEDIKAKYNAITVAEMADIFKQMGMEAVGGAYGLLEKAINLDASFSKEPDVPKSPPTLLPGDSSARGSFQVVPSNPFSFLPELKDAFPDFLRGTTKKRDLRKDRLSSVSKGYGSSVSPYWGSGDAVGMSVPLGIKVGKYDSASKGIFLSVEGNCPNCGQGFGAGHVAHDTSVSSGSLSGVLLKPPHEYSGELTDNEKREIKVYSGLSGVIQNPEDVHSDLNALTQMLFTEVGSNAAKSRRKEAIGIAYTALNRQKNAKKQGKDLSLYDVITGGEGYGRQGSRGRAYGTAGNVKGHEEDWKAIQDLARDILAGKEENPVGGATSFYHPSGMTGRAQPDFAKKESGSKNLANIGPARFYGMSGKDVPNRDALDQADIEAFNKRASK